MATPVKASFLFGGSELEMNPWLSAKGLLAGVQTNLEQCKGRLDYRDQLRHASNIRWAVGVTTAPRTSPTLKRSIACLTTSGWSLEVIHLFAEPNSFNSQDPQGITITQRGKRVGAFPNWYLALEELVLTQPAADAHLLCQDDIVCCRGLRRYLEKTLWPESAILFASLHCGMLQPRNDDARGVFTIRAPEVLYGALSLVFPAAAARSLLLSATVQRHRDGPQGIYGIDTILAAWIAESGLPALIDFPSLVGHIGKTSAIFPNNRDGPARYSDNFIGEAADASTASSLAP